MLEQYYYIIIYENYKLFMNEIYYLNYIMCIESTSQLKKNVITFIKNRNF